MSLWAVLLLSVSLVPLICHFNDYHKTSVTFKLFFLSSSSSVSYVFLRIQLHATEIQSQVTVSGQISQWDKWNSALLSFRLQSVVCFFVEIILSVVFYKRRLATGIGFEVECYRFRQKVIFRGYLKLVINWPFLISLALNITKFLWIGYGNWKILIFMVFQCWNG